MGSVREDVVRAFGPPDSAKPWNAGQEQLEYGSLRMTITFQAGKIIHMIVKFPAAAPGMKLTVFYFHPGDPAGVIQRMRSESKAAPAESDHHALMRYFKMKQVEFKTPPRIEVDDTAAHIKVVTSKEQMEEINAALSALMKETSAAVRANRVE